MIWGVYFNLILVGLVVFNDFSCLFDKLFIVVLYVIENEGSIWNIWYNVMIIVVFVVGVFFNEFINFSVVLYVLNDLFLLFLNYCLIICFIEVIVLWLY